MLVGAKVQWFLIYRCGTMATPVCEYLYWYFLKVVAYTSTMRGKFHFQPELPVRVRRRVRQLSATHSTRRCPPCSLPLDGFAPSAAFQKPTYLIYVQLTMVLPPPALSPPSLHQHHPRPPHPHPHLHNQAPTSASPSDALESPLANAFKARWPLSA